VWRIRPAELQDAGAVLTVRRAAFVTEAQLHDDPHIIPLTQPLEEVQASIVETCLLVAVDGTRIVGSVRAARSGDVWQMSRLAVAPDRQGEGIRMYERAGYVQVPNDSSLIRLSKPRTPNSRTPR
jgi:predicted N-acetyltransferase YhbS